MSQIKVLVVLIVLTSHHRIQKRASLRTLISIRKRKYSFLVPSELLPWQKKEITRETKAEQHALSLSILLLLYYKSDKIQISVKYLLQRFIKSDSRRSFKGNKNPIHSLQKWKYIKHCKKDAYLYLNFYTQDTIFSSFVQGKFMLLNDTCSLRLQNCPTAQLNRYIYLITKPRVWLV